MTTYLVVKTGRKGQTVGEIYRAGISGQYRLTGSWYRQITGACKRKGITGTLTVFKYADDAEAQALLAEYQQSFLQLRNNLSWQPVATLAISEEDLGAISDQCNEIISEQAVAQGRTYLDARGRRCVSLSPYALSLKEQLGDRSRAYIQAHNACIKDYKIWRKSQEALVGEELLDSYINLI